MACAAPARPVSPPAPESTLDRFVEVLRNGHSLFGLGEGCEEWRAEPGEPEVVFAESDYEENEETPQADDEQQDVWSPVGRLIARPDNKGRVYAFAYYLNLHVQPARMKISGRGSWSPAPGVRIRSSTNPDYGVIGTASYCISEADVRVDPTRPDAVLIGREPWFLTRDACLQSPSARNVAREGCSKGRPRS